ncbi:MAG: hypothetical protein U0414_42530 [Polyangiaceae bacterium]
MRARPLKTAPVEILRLPQLRGELVVDFVGDGVELAVTAHGGSVRRTIAIDAEDLPLVVDALKAAQKRIGAR